MYTEMGIGVQNSGKMICAQKKYAGNNNITVIENIPYNNVFNEALIERKTVAELQNNEIFLKIKNSWIKNINLVNN